MRQIQEGRNNGISEGTMGARIFSTYPDLSDPRLLFLMSAEESIYKNPSADPETIENAYINSCEKKLLPQLKKLEEMGKPLN